MHFSFKRPAVLYHRQCFTYIKTLDILVLGLPLSRLTLEGAVVIHGALVSDGSLGGRTTCD